jgi:hypothetical protein
MSFEFYRILHIVSIVIFFSMFGVAAYTGNSSKKQKIITGLSLLLIMVAGMGLKKFAAPGVWPLWLNIKMVIWLIVGGLGHVAVKKFPLHAVKAFWLSVGFLTLSSYLVNYRI